MEFLGPVSQESYPSAGNMSKPTLSPVAHRRLLASVSKVVYIRFVGGREQLKYKRLYCTC